MSIQVSGLDLVTEYLRGANETHGPCKVEAGFLDGDSFYVNLTGFDPFYTDADTEWLADIADHCAELLNRDACDGKEWVRYSEPNYWHGHDEVDDIKDADTIQLMIYEEDRQCK